MFLFQLTLVTLSVLVTHASSCSPRMDCTTVRRGRGIPDIPAYHGGLFEYTLPVDAFTSDGAYGIFFEGKLPSWLKYTSCVLKGTVPKFYEKRANIEVIARCNSSQGIVSTARDTFAIIYRSKPKAPQSTLNHHPLTGLRPLRLRLKVGEFGTTTIKPHRFVDEEDGNATSLWLSLTFKNGTQIAENFWLWFTQETLTVAYFPVFTDYREGELEFRLSARDSEGLTTHSPLFVRLEKAADSGYNHWFCVTIGADYDQFLRSKSLALFFSRLSTFSNGTVGLNNVVVLDLSLNRTGDVTIKFFVKFDLVDVCNREKIDELEAVLTSERLASRMKPYFDVKKVNVTEHGKCERDRSTHTPHPHHLIDITIFTAVTGVAIVAACVIIVIILRCRRRRRDLLNSAVNKTEKVPARRPVILPDDFRMAEVDYKGKKPVILIGEHGQTQPVESGPVSDGIRPPPPDYRLGSWSHDLSEDDSFGCHGNAVDDESLPSYRTLPLYTYNSTVLTEV